MKNKIKIFTALFLTLNIMPVFADGPTIAQAQRDLQKSIQNIYNNPKYANISPEDKQRIIEQVLGENSGVVTIPQKDNSSSAPASQPATPASTSALDCTQTQLDELRASAGTIQNDKCVPTECADGLTLTEGRCIDTKKIQEAQATYEEAKENEQSIENRTLTALTTAATGIGGMELAQGLAEQKADKDAAADMAAYIATMRCTYGDNQQVKAGTSQIELPGGNNSDLMKLRSEYFALAADLKTRKDALGLAPGIESQEILDKAQSGLYDDESITGTDGTYASLYRAQMLDSEKDKSQIEEDAKKSKTRVIAGGVAAGVGVVGGAVGDSLINGELHDLIEEKRNDDNE